MKKQILYVLAFMAVIAVACQSPKENALKEIDALEAQDSLFNLDNMAKLKDAYVAFADKYPDDERAPEFLFKAGQNIGAIASGNKDVEMHKEAITIFNRIQTTYPKHHYAEESLFMTGFVYENYLNDVAKAKIAYQELMTKYPDSELAEEAKLAIENAGVAPEDILKRAQQNNADSTVSVK
jgi:outer membrane protein assembly factor BamD (BamD/ComL family)